MRPLRIGVAVERAGRARTRTVVSFILVWELLVGVVVVMAGRNRTCVLGCCGWFGLRLVVVLGSML